MTVGIAEKAILRVTSPVLNNDVSKFKIDFGFADGESIQKYPKNFLQVFNRWGTRVYHEKGYNHNWDGSTTGLATMGSERKLPIGTYYYILDLGDGTTNQKLGWLYISK